MHRAFPRISCAAPIVLAGALLSLLAPDAVRAQDPPPCVEVGHGTAEIQVDSEGIASPECVEIVKNKVDVVWTGGQGVATLVVRFEAADEDKRLDNPDCAGATCTLSKLKAKKTGYFKYDVTVTRPDGSTRVVDPMLIIKN